MRERKEDGGTDGGPVAGCESVSERLPREMDRWANKVAVVTGASSGIGEAVSMALAQHGMRVVGLARRLHKLQAIADRLTDAKGTFYPTRCDVSKEEDILDAFRLADSLGGVDVLVNNAGVLFAEPITNGSTANFRTILDVNVLSGAICIREATRSMKRRRVSGHVINVNSVVGHNAQLVKLPISLYTPSKFALTAMTEVVRNELAEAGCHVKTTNLSPGLVKTDMPLAVTGGKADIFQETPYIEPKDIADAVLYVLGTPPNVQVTELTITPIKSPVGGINKDAADEP